MPARRGPTTKAVFQRPCGTLARSRVGSAHAGGPCWSRPSLVDEQQLLGIEVELALEPSPVPFYDAGSKRAPGARRDSPPSTAGTKLFRKSRDKVRPIPAALTGWNPESEKPPVCPPRFRSTENRSSTSDRACRMSESRRRSMLHSSTCVGELVRDYVSSPRSGACRILLA